MYKETLDINRDVKLAIFTGLSIRGVLSKTLGCEPPRQGQKIDCLDRVKCSGTDTVEVFDKDPERQCIHCFKCNTSSDMVDIVQQTRSMDFVETMKFLADLAGVTIPVKSIALTQEQIAEQNRLNTIYEINKAAAQFYNSKLNLKEDPTSSAAFDYLLARDIIKTSRDKFMIGVAGKNDLRTLFPDYDTNPYLLESGLVKEAQDRTRYDRFRNKIMFPYIDKKGNVIGFSARKFLPEDVENKQIPKYINSSNSDFFNKSEILFGEKDAFESLKDKSFVDSMLGGKRAFIVVEGPPCVVATHFYGFKSTVAASGLALSPKQFEKMYSRGNEITFCLDGDKAGLHAAAKLLEGAAPFLNSERTISFMMMPGAKDPADFLSIPSNEASDKHERASLRRKKLLEFKKIFDGRSKIHEVALSLMFSRASGSSELLDPKGQTNPEIVSEVLSMAARFCALVENDLYRNSLVRAFEAQLDLPKGSLFNHVEASRSSPLTTSFISLVNNQDPEFTKSPECRLGAILLLNPDKEPLLSLVKQELGSLDQNSISFNFLNRLTDFVIDKGSSLKAIDLASNFYGSEFEAQISQCADFAISCPQEICGEDSSVSLLLNMLKEKDVKAQIEKLEKNPSKTFSDKERYLELSQIQLELVRKRATNSTSSLSPR